MSHNKASNSGDEDKSWKPEDINLISFYGDFVKKRKPPSKSMAKKTVGKITTLRIRRLYEQENTRMGPQWLEEAGT